ncbi:MAG TPA: DUF4097 family beta strand repeat-containing protein [Vicinamibacteria bacterium]|nr:DUF4097 family beta strand repeat-containing protein [Vicinamibacteria bacterium]
MRRSFRVALALTAGMGFVCVVHAQIAEDFERSVPFNPGGDLVVQNRNGSISISACDEPTVRIEVEKRAESEEALRDIEIRVEGSGDSVRIETLHHRRRDGGKVDYRICLPAQASIMATTANGAVTIDGLSGRVKAYSTNGSLKLDDIEGEIEAATTNGSINASYRRLNDGRHRFSTTNGSVRVCLPKDAGGDFDAETVNGSIEVEFPLTLTRTSRRHLSGSFGSGSGSFEFRTVNGSVKLLAN